MRIREAMTPGVECVKPGDCIIQAAEKMRDLDVGALPVCGDNGRLLGMVTDRDITLRATASALDPSQTCVRDVMTYDVIHCFEDQDIQDAVDIIEREQVRRLVVLSRDQRLVGILSLGDIAVKNPNEQLCGEALERVSQPAEPLR